MKTKFKKAFTLIEMAIVLFIISLLLLIVLPNLGKQREHASTVGDSALKTEYETQKQLYLGDHPSESDVTAEKLQSEGYISKSQADKIANMHK